jgi:hypothetical protein
VLTVSRFASDDGDGDYTINPYHGWRAAAISGKTGLQALRDLLAHLEGLPRKRILVNHVYEPETGDACIVGEVLKMRGFSQETLASIEERHMQESDGGAYSLGWEGITITEGKKAGLSKTLAFELAYHNDHLDGEYVSGACGPPRPAWLYASNERAGFAFFSQRKIMAESPELLQAEVDRYHRGFNTIGWSPASVWREYGPEERYERTLVFLRELIEEGEKRAKRREERREAP